MTPSLCCGGWKPWQLWTQPGSATEPNVHIAKPDTYTATHVCTCVRAYISTIYVYIVCACAICVFDLLE